MREIPHAELILDYLVAGQRVLALDARAVFRHVDDWAAVAVGCPLQQLAEARRVRSQPGALCFGADPIACFVLHQDVQVTG